MFKAFFDEASDNTQDFLMAGWLARFDEWEKFSNAWDWNLRAILVLSISTTTTLWEQVSVRGMV